MLEMVQHATVPADGYTAGVAKETESLLWVILAAQFLQESRLRVIVSGKKLFHSHHSMVQSETGAAMALGACLAQEILALQATRSGSHGLLSIRAYGALQLLLFFHLKQLQESIDEKVGLQSSSST